MPRGNQLTRQWRLLQLIDRRIGGAVDGAAGSSTAQCATIWRDLQELQHSFPIYADQPADGERSIWRLREEFRLRLPLKLSLSELAALVIRTT